MTDPSGIDDAISADWLRAAQAVAVARAARDEHRAHCPWDVAECPRCIEPAALVKQAKQSLFV